MRFKLKIKKHNKIFGNLKNIFIFASENQDPDRADTRKIYDT